MERKEGGGKERRKEGRKIFRPIYVFPWLLPSRPHSILWLIPLLCHNPSDVWGCLVSSLVFFSPSMPLNPPAVLQVTCLTISSLLPCFFWLYMVWFVKMCSPRWWIRWQMELSLSTSWTLSINGAKDQIKWPSNSISGYRPRRMEKGMPPTPVFLPGESHGQRSLLGYSP